MPQAERMRGFAADKFGMFLHWGPYAVAQCEASWPLMMPEVYPGPAVDDYVALPERFSAPEFDPYAWVDAAVAAGQRYLVLTAKHHDGFCMWDTAFSDYKVTSTPLGRDVVGELAEACHGRGLRFGIYYSPPDMHHPGYRDTTRPVHETWHGDSTRPQWASYLDYMRHQLTELLTGYGPVSVVWFDGLERTDRYDPIAVLSLIRELQPDCLVNNRLGFVPDRLKRSPWWPTIRGDYETPEQYTLGAVPTMDDEIPVMVGEVGSFAGVSSGLQRAVPPLDRFRWWEACATIGSTWAHCESDVPRPAAEHIRALAHTVGRGGNLLLNVGPTAAGTLDPRAVQVLGEVGAWARANADAVYGTVYGPVQDLDGVVSTARDGTVYLLLTEPRQTVEVPGSVRSATWLSCEQELRTTRRGDATVIEVGECFEEVVPVIALDRTS